MKTPLYLLWHTYEKESGAEESKLIGGLYGVSIGKMFAGESMFYRKPNASKLALTFLVEELKSKGVSWIDCQVMTPLLKNFGAVEVSRDEYMKLLSDSLSKEVKLF